MAKRGRPEGHILSDESKQKISESKTGQLHTMEVRDKIGQGVKAYFETPAGKRTKKRTGRRMRAYFKTPQGQAQKEKISLFMTMFWSSPEGLGFKESLSLSMKDYYEENIK